MEVQTGTVLIEEATSECTIGIPWAMAGIGVDLEHV